MGEDDYDAGNVREPPDPDPVPDQNPAPDPAPPPPLSPRQGEGDHFPFDPPQHDQMLQPQNEPFPVEIQPNQMEPDPPPLVVQQQAEPVPLPQPVAGPAVLPAARTGARAKEPKPPHEWRSRQKGKWADSTPTR